MTQHQRKEFPALICDECMGRSYADPTKIIHKPDCSRYSTWRFGPRRERFTIRAAVRKSICPHGFDDWTECQGCTDAADYDDGGPE